MSGSLHLIGVSCCVACLFVRFDKVYIKRLILLYLAPVRSGLAEIQAISGTENDMNVIRSYDTTEVLQDLSLVLLVTTFVLLLPVLFGISGLYINKLWLIAIFIVITGILVVAKTTLIITSSLSTDLVKGWIKDPLMTSLQTRYRGDLARDSISVTWNMVMTKFSCCGVDSGRDFKFSRFRRDFTLRVFNQTLLLSNLQTPIACCNSASRTTSFEPGACAKYPIQREHTHYFEGCFEKIWNSLSQYSGEMILSAVGICAVQVLQVILACVYVELLKRDRKDQIQQQSRTYRKGSDFFFPSVTEE
ncbi:tetraspanin-18-like [Saccostrea echinata]|uniref:tetraspanin-18-like n=1 Tax=Saccostrea echinata TaxID=191078 RepID=UPI002A7EC3B3|nr:tetraspanin-18-like [Saccostrea echinata]